MCAVTYITEISLIVTLNNQFTHSLTFTQSTKFVLYCGVCAFFFAHFRGGAFRYCLRCCLWPSFSVAPRDASAVGRPFRNSVRSQGRSVVTYSSFQNCGLPVPPRVELCKNSIADLLLRGSPLYQILVGMANVQL